MQPGYDALAVPMPLSLRVEAWYQVRPLVLCVSNTSPSFSSQDNTGCVRVYCDVHGFVL